MTVAELIEALKAMPQTQTTALDINMLRQLPQDAQVSSLEEPARPGVVQTNITIKPDLSPLGTEDPA